MLADDAGVVLAIYQTGLDTGQASFETVAPDWGAFDAAKLGEHRHVAVDPATGRVAGWVAVSPVSSRAVYAGWSSTASPQFWLSPPRGVGGALLRALVASSEAAGIWTIQSGVFPENAASLRLHDEVGFRVAGVRERVGCHNGVWRDTILTERRSSAVGAG